MELDQSEVFVGDLVETRELDTVTRQGGDDCCDCDSYGDCPG